MRLQRILTFGLVLGIMMAFAQDNQHQVNPPMMHSNSYGLIALVLEQLPEWPKDRTLTEDEVRRLLLVAQACAVLDSIRDLQIAEIVYLNRVRDRGWSGTPEEWYAHTSKLFLLHRVLFDFSDDHKPNRHAPPDATFTYVWIDGRTGEPASYMFPFQWEDELPQLEALRGNVPGGSGWWYEPHLELPFFARRFEFRNDFERLTKRTKVDFDMLSREFHVDQPHDPD